MNTEILSLLSQTLCNFKIFFLCAIFKQIFVF